MACKTKKITQDITMEAAKIYWGREECRDITFVDDEAGDYDKDWFKFETVNAKGETKEYGFYLSTSDTDTDKPAEELDWIRVVYEVNDSASDIAGLVETALNDVDNAIIKKDKGVLTIKNTYVGAADTKASTSPNFTFETGAGIGGYLGRTAEGIEVSIETAVQEITANQSGGLVLDEIGNGQSASCTAGFIELTQERLEALIAGAIGGAFELSDGSKIIGGGESKLFQSLKGLGGKLILHPQRLPDEDRTKDLIFWNSAPKPESINYSGTEVQTLNTTFSAYLDDSKPAEINLWAIGDWVKLEEDLANA